MQRMLEPGGTRCFVSMSQTWCDIVYANFFGQDLYSAGMILVLSKSCLPLQDEFDVQSADRAWFQCCEILRSLEPYGSAPEVGLESLLAMYDRLVPSENAGMSSLRLGQ